MDLKLRILLAIFSLIWFIIIIFLLKDKKIPVKYSMVWFLTSITLASVSIFPSTLKKITSLIGFETTSNMIIGIILCLLLLITIVLTMIVSKQGKAITLLIQEVSLINENEKDH